VSIIKGNAIVPVKINSVGIMSILCFGVFENSGSLRKIG